MDSPFLSQIAHSFVSAMAWFWDIDTHPKIYRPHCPILWKCFVCWLCSTTTILYHVEFLWVDSIWSACPCPTHPPSGSSKWISGPKHSQCHQNLAIWTCRVCSRPNRSFVTLVRHQIDPYTVLKTWFANLLHVSSSWATLKICWTALVAFHSHSPLQTPEVARLGFCFVE